MTRTRLTFTNVGPDWRIGFAAGVASRLYWGQRHLKVVAVNS
jgi:hypothetical protein